MTVKLCPDAARFELYPQAVRLGKLWVYPRRFEGDVLVRQGADATVEMVGVGSLRECRPAWWRRALWHGVGRWVWAVQRTAPALARTIHVDGPRLPPASPRSPIVH